MSFCSFSKKVSLKFVGFAEYIAYMLWRNHHTLAQCMTKIEEHIVVYDGFGRDKIQRLLIHKFFLIFSFIPEQVQKKQVSKHYKANQ